LLDFQEERSWKEDLRVNIEKVEYDRSVDVNQTIRAICELLSRELASKPICITIYQDAHDKVTWTIVDKRKLEEFSCVSYPALAFDVRHGTIGVVILGTFYGVLKDVCPNYLLIRHVHREMMFLDKEPRLIEKGFKGKYAIVMDDGKVSITDTEGSALTFAGDDGFVAQIGVRNRADLTTGLPEDELPEDIHTQVETDEPVLMTTTYIEAGHRRWVRGSLLLENRRWRTVYFLIDTGAASCYITSQFREGLYAPPNLFGLFGQVYKSVFLGVPIILREAENATNVNIRNVNLIEANFLNQFALIDDFASRTLLLLRRPDTDVVQDILV
jgi:hypothetical protein